VAETYLLFNAVTQGAFRTSPVEFLFTPKGLSQIGKDSTWVVSLPEIIKFGAGPDRAYGGAANDTLMEVVQANLGFGTQPGKRQGEWVKVAAQMVAIPLVFRMGKKLARPMLTRTRKLLKDTGLKGTVTV